MRQLAGRPELRELRRVVVRTVDGHTVRVQRRLQLARAAQRSRAAHVELAERRTFRGGSSEGTAGCVVLPARVECEPAPQLRVGRVERLSPGGRVVILHRLHVVSTRLGEAPAIEAGGRTERIELQSRRVVALGNAQPSLRIPVALVAGCSCRSRMKQAGVVENLLEQSALVTGRTVLEGKVRESPIELGSQSELREEVLPVQCSLRIDIVGLLSARTGVNQLGQLAADLCIPQSSSTSPSPPCCRASATAPCRQLLYSDDDDERSVHGGDLSGSGSQLLTSAYSLAARGEHRAACESFDAALRETPDADGWNAFGHALAALGDHGRAEAAFAESARLNPHLTAAQFGRAQSLLQLGNPAGAEGLFRATLAPRGHVEAAYYGLGQALAQQRRFEEAVAALDEWQRITAADPSTEAAQQSAIERGVPALVFVAMQKSASEYIRSVLLAATDAPLLYPDLGTFPRNFMVPRLTARVARGGCVTRLHLDPSEHNLDVLERAGVRRIAVHLRDPRAATVSFAHHLARIGEQEFQHSRLYHDPVLPLEFRAWPFEMQLAWATANYFPGALEIARAWYEVARAGQRASRLAIHLTTYKTFTRDPRRFFAELFAFFGWHPAKLDEVIASHQKELDRNFRSGRTQEWRETLTLDQQKLLHEQIGNAGLDELGWS